jgi:hypothetical protein
MNQHTLYTKATLFQYSLPAVADQPVKRELIPRVCDVTRSSALITVISTV